MPDFPTMIFVMLAVFAAFQWWSASRAAAERALNKLARTYTAQVEALKQYRSKGQQIVRVERVNVESGGQAVVGHVQHGGRADGQR